MKRIFAILALVALVLTSCEDTKPKNNGKLDPSAKVYINAAKAPQSTPSKAEGKTLTPKEIVEQAQVIWTDKGSIGVDDWNRDVANTRFIVGSDWVISDRGELEPFFIESRNFAFVTVDENNRPKDTLAYIPNEVMQNAEIAIKAAYAAEDYTECYRLLQEAFEFTPSTDVE